MPPSPPSLQLMMDVFTPPQLVAKTLELCIILNRNAAASIDILFVCFICSFPEYITCSANDYISFLGNNQPFVRGFWQNEIM